ncbi:hypothetical protein BAE44_0021689 [Dichanthelium oligosanthes]|uniref:Membrane-associated kinase regulator 2 n=1 Tax=Dichanthelium oligosanthes TaxID=888268 RepID=A0A1E5UWH4_9POAL|nr:hypothetical protein BAE44_0021689 [Dichanthelium oligosanthes]
MQILRLLAARRFRRRRRAVSTITATATAPVTPRGGGCGGYGCTYGEEEDEGPFFDLDLSCCSAPASSAGSQAAESGSESDDYTSACAAAASTNASRGDLDFVISLQRSRTASPSYEERLFCRGAAPREPPPPPPLMFCASEPSDAASRARRSSASRRGMSGRLQLRTLSFGSAKAAFYGGRASFSRSTSSSARSAAGLFAAYGGYGSPDDPQDDEARARPPSGDVIRRYLSKISSRLRRVSVAVAPAAAADLRLQKSRSASAAQVSAAAQSPAPARRDDSLVEKQDGIASAIAHCKESLHRASVSELDTSLLRSRSDPGP